MRDTLTGLGVIALALTIPALIALALAGTGIGDAVLGIFGLLIAAWFYGAIILGLLAAAVALVKARQARRY